MTDPILVTYASRAGSTAAIAEAIGGTLAETGVAVEVRPMADVKDLAPYRAVVAGSAIRGCKFLPEATRFLDTQRAALARKPFAAFLVCISLGIPGNPYQEGVSKWLDPVRAVAKPVSEGLFAGALDLDRLPWGVDAIGLRIAVAFGALPKGDHRDWDAIRAWAAALPSKLSA